jgi:uncharacterized protein (DUF2252 family)
MRISSTMLRATASKSTNSRWIVGAGFGRSPAPKGSPVEELFETKQARKLVASLRCRSDDVDITIVDAAYWVKGCSSLGKFRAAVLVRAGDKGGTIDDGSICLMDVKEGVCSSAPWMDGEAMPRHHGERVVQGARSLAPFLGERMLAAPAWLWSSPLDLIAVHERAYLEHCRKHALGSHAAA